MYIYFLFMACQKKYIFAFGDLGVPAYQHRRLSLESFFYRPWTTNQFFWKSQAGRTSMEGFLGYLTYALYIKSKTILHYWTEVQESPHLGWVQKVHFWGILHHPKIDPGYRPAECCISKSVLETLCYTLIITNLSEIGRFCFYLRTNVIQLICSHRYQCMFCK